MESAPGLIVYRFEAPLFFANADYFSVRVKHLAAMAPHPVKLLVFDLVSMGDIDYTAGLVFVQTLKDFQSRGVTIAVAQADDVRAQMDALGITAIVGADKIYVSVGDALENLDPRDAR